MVIARFGVAQAVIVLFRRHRIHGGPSSGERSGCYSESGGDRFAKAVVRSTNVRDVAHDSHQLSMVQEQQEQREGDKRMQSVILQGNTVSLNSGGIGLSGLLKSVCAMLDSRLGEGSTSSLMIVESQTRAT